LQTSKFDELRQTQIYPPQLSKLESKQTVNGLVLPIYDVRDCKIAAGHWPLNQLLNGCNT